jgi:glycosyltransferase involved in cell wall biosynthesis
MKIGIYNMTPSGLGGAGQSVAVLAAALSLNHQVEILHHKRTLTISQIAAFSGANLESVGLRTVDSISDMINFNNADPHYVKDLAKTLQEWGAYITESYDLFITFTHDLPLYCYARHGLLTVLFPSGQIKDVHREIWKNHLDSYHLKIANSFYTRKWAKRRWDIDCGVIYPPAETAYSVIDKENIILSVGRFKDGNTKKQLEMLSAFGRMKEGCIEGWEYFSVGGISEAPCDQAFFNSVQGKAEECHAQLRPNLDLASLKRLYEKAKIFWHAAGYGEDEDMRPERSEHFGIVTVEAMASGCIPIVINKGGQPEIIKHGVNGFVWDTPRELEEYTMLVARDDMLRKRMLEAARSHAQLYSRDEFANQYTKHVMSMT